jgi:hypothetical protein
VAWTYKFIVFSSPDKDFSDLEKVKAVAILEAIDFEEAKDKLIDWIAGNALPGNFYFLLDPTLNLRMKDVFWVVECRTYLPGKSGLKDAAKLKYFQESLILLENRILGKLVEGEDLGPGAWEVANDWLKEFDAEYMDKILGSLEQRGYIKVKIVQSPEGNAKLVSVTPAGRGYYRSLQKTPV